MSSGETPEGAGQRDTGGWDMFNAQCHSPQDVPHPGLGSPRLLWCSLGLLWWHWADPIVLVWAVVALGVP